MNRQRTRLLERIEESGKELLAHLGQVSEAEIHRSPGGGEWSIHAIVAHLRDTEQQVFLGRIERILKQDEPPQVADFDQEEWNREHYNPREPLKKIVSEWRAARRKELRLLRAAPDALWSRYAVHPYYGKTSIDYLVTHNYSHTLDHLHQMLERREKQLLAVLNG